MNFPRVPFTTPYFDPTGLGFKPPRPDQLNWRAFTIVTICFDPTEREAVFVNADGYAVPLEPHPYEVNRLLRHAVNREYGKVCGSGQFAMKPARVTALISSGQLKRWVVYHLEQPAHYANESTAWAAYVESDLIEECRAIEATTEAMASVELPWTEKPAPDCLKAIEERRTELMAWYRERKAENDAVNAWLRGDVPTAPLLQALAG
ncbi:MAG: hypothetical protein ACK5NQ_12300 [Pseudomonas sp.]